MLCEITELLSNFFNRLASDIPPVQNTLTRSHLGVMKISREYAEVAILLWLTPWFPLIELLTRF